MPSLSLWRRPSGLLTVVVAATLTFGIITARGAVAQAGRDADRDAIRAHIDRTFKAYIAKNRAEVNATHDREWRGFLTGSRRIVRLGEQRVAIDAG